MLRQLRPKVQSTSFSEIFPRGNLAVMMVAGCLVSISNISMAFLPIYFTSLGGTVIQYGLVSGMAMLAGIPSTIIGGAIVPKQRLKRVAVATSWIGPCIFLGYYFSSNWIALSAVMVMAAASSIGSTTSRQLIADATIKKNRAGQLSLYQTLSTLPAMFSPAIGGYLVSVMGISEGFKLGVIFAIGASAISNVFIIKYLRDGAVTSTNVRQNASSENRFMFLRKISADIAQRLRGHSLHLKQTFALHFANFFRNTASLPGSLAPLLSAFALVTAANAAAGSYFIFYATGIAKLDTFQWGLILSSQLVLANLIRTPLGMIADRHDRRKVLLLAILLTAPLPTIFVFMHSFWGMLVVSLILVATGIHYVPTHEAYQIELTPREKRPALFVIYDVLSNAARFGGVVLGGLLFTVSYVLPFYTFTVLEVCAAGIITASLFLRRFSSHIVT